MSNDKHKSESDLLDEAYQKHHHIERWRTIRFDLESASDGSRRIYEIEVNRITNNKVQTMAFKVNKS